MSFSCYCLVSETGSTYVGFSTNVDHRLRQHNCEIKGGAKATHGHTWRRILTLTGFPTQQAALQFEWKWKQMSRRERGSPVDRRCSALIRILNMEQSTSKAVPFHTYENPLWILLEDPSLRSLFSTQIMLYGVLLD